MARSTLRFDDPLEEMQVEFIFPKVLKRFDSFDDPVHVRTLAQKSRLGVDTFKSMCSSETNRKMLSGSSIIELALEDQSKYKWRHLRTYGTCSQSTCRRLPMITSLRQIIGVPTRYFMAVKVDILW